MSESIDLKILEERINQTLLKSVVKLPGEENTKKEKYKKLSKKDLINQFMEKHGLLEEYNLIINKNKK